MGGLNATLHQSYFVAPDLDSVGAFASAVIPADVRTALLAGDGALSATGTGSYSRTASVSGAGTLTGTATPSHGAAAGLAGTGTLATTITPIYPVLRTAVLRGNSELATELTQIQTVSADLLSTGELQAALSVEPLPPSVGWTTEPIDPVRVSGPSWTTDPTPPELIQRSNWFERVDRASQMVGDGGLACAIEPWVEIQADLHSEGQLQPDISAVNYRSLVVVSEGTLAAEMARTVARAADFGGEGGLTATINDGLHAIVTPVVAARFGSTGQLQLTITGGKPVALDGLTAEVIGVGALPTANPALTGAGALDAETKAVYSMTAPQDAEGTLTADVLAITGVPDSWLAGDGALTATMVSAFTQITEENTNRTNYPIPVGASGVWVTLIAGGGSGGAGMVGASGTTRAGGGGGGGGAKIDRFFIDAALLTSGVYTVNCGVGGTTSGGGFSRFVSSGITLLASGGGAGGDGSNLVGTAGAGATATQTGITGATLRTGGNGSTGSNSSNPAPDAPDSALDRAGGGGGGGAYNSANVLGAGGDGGSSATCVGGNGAAGGNTLAGAGGDALPGYAGAGSGGAGARGSGPNTPPAGGNGGGGGGGGGATGSGTSTGGHGGPGYTLIEWV